MTTRHFKTDLRCDGCVAVVKPHLDREPGVVRWEVDLASPDKTLTVEGEAPAETVRAAVARGGFQVLGESGQSGDSPSRGAATCCCSGPRT